MSSLTFSNSLRTHQVHNHNCDGAWISDLNQHRFLRFYFYDFMNVINLNIKHYGSLSLHLNTFLLKEKKIYKTRKKERRKTVFGHNSKHREVVISTLVSVFGNVVKTRSFVFHILLETPALCQLITILSSLTIKHFNNDTQFKNA